MNHKSLLILSSAWLISLSLAACNSNPPAAPNSTNQAPAPSQSSTRYQDNGDGTVTDLKTKLMWKKCLEGRSGTNCQLGNVNTSAFLWNETPALSQASFAKHSDWRLPTLQELNGLVKCGNGKPSDFKSEVTSCWGADRKGTYTSPTIDTQAFPNLPEFAYIWTATGDDKRPGSKFMVSFNDGGLGGAYTNNTNRYQVLLVRKTP